MADLGAECESIPVRILKAVAESAISSCAARSRICDGDDIPPGGSARLQTCLNTASPDRLTRIAGSTNSNDAVVISLVTPSATGVPKSIAIFHPTFTYPIFGDEESIFGYQGLKIHLRYHASSMRPNIDVTFNKKFKTVGETEATDIKATLEDWLPKGKSRESSLRKWMQVNIQQPLSTRIPFSTASFEATINSPHAASSTNRSRTETRH
jgi:hypothetical protein